LNNLNEHAIAIKDHSVLYPRKAARYLNFCRKTDFTHSCYYEYKCASLVVQMCDDTKAHEETDASRLDAFIASALEFKWRHRGGPVRYGIEAGWADDVRKLRVGHSDRSLRKHTGVHETYIPS
jgi:hypothetical protein